MAKPQRQMGPASAINQACILSKNQEDVQELAFSDVSNVRIARSV